MAAGRRLAGRRLAGLLPPPVVAQTLLGAVTMLMAANVMAGSWERVTPVAGVPPPPGPSRSAAGAARPVVAGVGVFGVLMFLPATIVTFFGDTVGVPVAFLLIGAVLLALAVRHLRHPGAGVPPRAQLERPAGRRLE